MDNKRIQNEQEEQKLVTRYGNVSEAVYKRKFLRFEKLKNEPLDDTLQEYYDHYFEEGIFKVRYNASCDLCGFSFEYKHYVPFNLDGTKIEIDETQTSEENLEIH